MHLLDISKQTWDRMERLSSCTPGECAIVSDEIFQSLNQFRQPGDSDDQTLNRLLDLVEKRESVPHSLTNSKA